MLCRGPGFHEDQLWYHEAIPSAVLVPTKAKDSAPWRLTQPLYVSSASRTVLSGHSYPQHDDAQPWETLMPLICEIVVL